jgi:hypothetical protein
MFSRRVPRGNQHHQCPFWFSIWPRCHRECGSQNQQSRSKVATRVSQWAWTRPRSGPGFAKTPRARSTSGLVCRLLRGCWPVAESPAVVVDLALHRCLVHSEVVTERHPRDHRLNGQPLGQLIAMRRTPLLCHAGLSTGRPLGKPEASRSDLRACGILKIRFRIERPQA